MHTTQIVTASPQRALMSRAKNWLKNVAGILNPDSFIISPSTLRYEKALSANDAGAKFVLRSGDVANRANENKIQQNDLFFISHIGLALVKNDEVASPNVLGPMFTYPDPNHFEGVSGGVNEWECLENIYNGYSEFKTSTNTRIPKIANFHFRYAPETQVLTNALVGATHATYPGYGPDKAQRGLYELGDMLIIDGEGDHNYNVFFSEGERSQIAGLTDNGGSNVNTRNFLVLLLDGILVSDAGSSLKAYMNQSPFA